MSTQDISVIKTDNNNILLLKPWLIWGCSAVFVLFQFFLQLSSGVIVKDLMHAFSITAVGAGILSSTYYYVYVALQTPAGMLIDRYGPRKLLTGGAIVCAIGCWWFAIAQTLWLAEIGRLFMGAGSSFAFVGSLFLISQWFPTERFAFMVGVAETIGTLGTLVGDIFLATLLNNYGWRTCMMGAAFIAMALFLLCWLIIRDRPKTSSYQLHNKQHPNQSNHQFLQNVVLLIKSPQAWLNGIYSGIQFAIITVFVALWGIPFFMEAYKISVTAATILASAVFVGLAIGCPAVGLVSRFIKSRRWFLIISALLNAVLLLVIILLTNLSMIVLSILLFFLGILCSSYVLNYAIANEIAPQNGISTCIGFTNTLAVITAPLLQPLIGAILHFVNHYHNGQQHYTVFDYQISLLLLPLCLVIGGICAYYIHDEHEEIK